MNEYQKKLQEKKLAQNKIPTEKKKDAKKRHAHAIQHTKKNAQFGMF